MRNININENVAAAIIWIITIPAIVWFVFYNIEYTLAVFLGILCMFAIDNSIDNSGPDYDHDPGD